MTVRDRLTPLYALLPVVALCVLYSVFTSYRYLWDSLVDCFNLETAESAGDTIHPLHPAYPFVFLPLKTFIADLSGRSIHILRWVSTVFSVIGLLTFHSILARKTKSILTACIGTAFLGIFTAWWHHSITANPYIIATALLLLAAREFLTREQNDRLRLPLHFIFLTLSVLFLRFTSLFLIPFAIAEYVHKRSQSNSSPSAIRATMIYTASGILILLIAFLIFPVLVSGIHSYDDFSDWAENYQGALPGSVPDVEKSFRGLFSAGLGSISAMPRNANMSFQGESGASIDTVTSIYYIVLVVVTLGLFFSIRFFNITFSDSSSDKKAFFAFLVISFLIVGGGAVILHPYSLSHRLLILPVIILILASWLQPVLARLPGKAHIIWILPIIALLANNWTVKFDKDRVRENNPYIYEAEKAAEIINPEDLLIDTGVDVGQFRHGYLRYFAGIESKHLFELEGVPELDVPLFRKTLSEYLLDGGKLYVHQDAIEDAESMARLADGVGADIYPEDLRSFFDEAVEPDYFFIINSRNYYAMRIKTN